MGMKKWAAVAVVVALAACAQDQAGEENAAETEAPAAETAAPVAMGTPPQGATAEMVTQGQQIFSSTGNCFTCHGPDAKGGQLAPNLSDAEWLNTDGTYDGIQNVVRTGVMQPKQFPAPMPAMGGAQLSDDQVKQVSAYVWSLGGGK